MSGRVVKKIDNKKDRPLTCKEEHGLSEESLEFYKTADQWPKVNIASGPFQELSDTEAPNRTEDGSALPPQVELPAPVVQKQSAACRIHLMVDPRVRTEEWQFKKIPDPKPERLFFGSGILVNGFEIDETLPTHCVLTSVGTITFMEYCTDLSDRGTATAKATFDTPAGPVEVTLDVLTAFRSARQGPFLDMVLIGVAADDVAKLSAVEPLEMKYGMHIPTPDHSVFIASHPADGESPVAWLQWSIETHDRHCLQYPRHRWDKYVSSGAAVLDKWGNLLGIHFRGFNRPIELKRPFDGITLPPNTMQVSNISCIVEDLLPWDKKNLDHTHINRDLGGWADKPKPKPKKEKPAPKVNKSYKPAYDYKVPKAARNETWTQIPEIVDGVLVGKSINSME